MKFSIQLTLKSAPDLVFNYLKNPSVFTEVSAPFLTFVPVQPKQFPNRYKSGGCYVVKVCFLRFFVVGQQEINPVFEETEAGKIFRDSGKGLSGALSLVSKFEHQMTLTDDPEKNTVLLDELEFRGGLLTPLIGIFFFVFWKWRHFKLSRFVVARNGQTGS